MPEHIRIGEVFNDGEPRRLGMFVKLFYPSEPHGMTITTQLQLSKSLSFTLHRGHSNDARKSGRGPTAWWSTEANRVNAPLLGGDVTRMPDVIAEHYGMNPLVAEIWASQIIEVERKLSLISLDALDLLLPYGHAYYTVWADRMTKRVEGLNGQDLDCV